MTDEEKSFKVGIDFASILSILSKQVYETPLAFIRENVQNAVDAVRIQALREQVEPADTRYRIDVSAEQRRIEVRDNGTGMTPRDLETFFWSIGASGKRTAEARAAGCVGMFGIGGFANFGVCDSVEVVSQTESAAPGTLTRLSDADIEAAQGTIPGVRVSNSDLASPRGTVVIGHLRENARINDVRDYLHDFVRFVPIAVFFNGDKLSQNAFSAIEERENLTPVGDEKQEWQEGDFTITGRLFEDRGHTLVASIRGLCIGTEQVKLFGHVRFENGTFDVFKRGFKLCATSVPTIVGVSGRLDCDRFVPTAGRDSLDAATSSLVNRIIQALERVAVEAILESPERIAQYTRIFRYINQRGLFDKLANARVSLADGSQVTLGWIKRASERDVSVYFGTAQKQALNQIMQSGGHIVVLLSADHQRQQAERVYLERFCAAKPFDGIIACQEHFTNLSRFERVVLSELETNIRKSYEVTDFRLIPGKLTEDIPVYVKETAGNQPPEIFIDVRHKEIVKLEPLGYSQLLYSLIATFCREYLGPSLKKWSPRFFGDGAINLELLAKRRSEFWLLLKDDIGVVRKGGQRHVVTQSDVRVVTVGSGNQQQPEAPPGKQFPRLLRIIDDQSTTGVGGYYIRLPDTAFNAYGDLLPECDNRGVTWGGNRILYVASDTVSAAFQYEIVLDKIVSTEANGVTRGEGAVPLDRPLQEMFGGLYFPIPQVLERFLVPQGDEEIRLQLNCDWFDMRTARHWAPKDSAA
jgi:molecular chaperone HtpG